MKNALEIAAIIKEARANPAAFAAPARPYGCGRIYIYPSAGGIGRPALSPAEKRAANAALKKGGEAAGLRWIPAMKCLYVGYDNNSGVELRLGEAIVNALNAAGVPCYRDEVGD